MLKSEDAAEDGILVRKAFAEPEEDDHVRLPIDMRYVVRSVLRAMLTITQSSERLPLGQKTTNP